jgi:hypothetical protein
MPDYWIKITETEGEEQKNHHYLITADSEGQARKLTMKFLERFIDDDDDPEKIENGYAFYNKAVFIRLAGIRETTKEQFKDFLLKTHTIDMS